MVPRSSVEYLSSARESDFTSPVIRSPFRIHTESVFCASACPLQSTMRSRLSPVRRAASEHSPAHGDVIPKKLSSTSQSATSTPDLLASTPSARELPLGSIAPPPVWSHHGVVVIRLS